MTKVLPITTFPNIYWYSLYLAADDVILEQHENYQKQTWRNRYDIADPHGKVSLTIPIIGQKGIKTSVQEIRIKDSNWARTHLRTIETAYNSSPYYLYFEDDLKRLFETPYDILLDFNIASLNFINDCLQIEEKHTLSGSYMEGTIEDYRSNFKASKKQITCPEYLQVFTSKYSFIPNLSLLDLVFNLGSEALLYLENHSTKIKVQTKE